MIVRRYITTASVVATMAFGLAGSAAATTASDVTLGTTGPDSYNSVVTHNSSEIVTNNTSNVQVTNENFQDASTGDVSANKNTTVEGGLTSGDASNTNGTVNTVAVSNESAATTPEGGNGGTTPTTPGSGGAVQGASTTEPGMGGGAAVLPEVGASVPMDVSALRAAWHPATNAPTAVLAKSSSVFTAAMLVTATLLSLLGALGSAVYARRKERV